MAMLNLGDTLVPWRTWKKDNQNHGGRFFGRKNGIYMDFIRYFCGFYMVVLWILWYFSELDEDDEGTYFFGHLYELFPTVFVSRPNPTTEFWMPAGILTDWHSVQFFCTREISPTSCPKWHLDTFGVESVETSMTLSLFAHFLQRTLRTFSAVVLGGPRSIQFPLDDLWFLSLVYLKIAQKIASVFRCHVNSTSKGVMSKVADSPGFYTLKQCARIGSMVQMLRNLEQQGVWNCCAWIGERFLRFLMVFGHFPPAIPCPMPSNAPAALRWAGRWWRWSTTNWPFAWQQRLSRRTRCLKSFSQGWCYIIWQCVKTLVPLVNMKIAGKWMFIPLKMVLIGIDP